MAIEEFAGDMIAGFNHLNIIDLLAAREQYHVFLTRHPNVVATAIGRYLIRKSGYDTLDKDGEKQPRTLANSEIHPEKSWPCVLVFVDTWQSEKELVNSKSPGAVLPKTLYLPDGRAVPVCLVEAKRDLAPVVTSRTNQLRYPTSVIGGGFPLEVTVQNRDHVATVGCLVTDGSKYYGLTNRHVCGEPGRTVFARLGGERVAVGVSAGTRLQLSKLALTEMYPGWPAAHLFVNADVGLVDIDDVNQWRTDVFTLGALGPLIDFNINSLTLSVIGTKVKGYGAGSGPIEGQVSALFYRYRSMGGIEYVSDFFIGPNDVNQPVVRHGDSGAVLSLVMKDNSLRPFAVTWGAHEFVAGPERTSMGYALATGLGNVCRLLDVDLVRGWNVDVPYTWGKTGHFKIGFRAADLVSDSNLAKLLRANQASLGYANAKLVSQDTVGGTFTHDFVPLADVADIIWRTTRPNDESNHFADIDESDRRVSHGKTLMDLSFENDDNIDVGVWLKFDEKMDEVDPIRKKSRKTGKIELRPREGALPFRVWQMYKQMIKSLSDGNVDEFLVAGGTMAHYVGDACQALHISALHHGEDASESGVHSDYETALIDHKAEELFDGVDAINRKVAKKELIGPDGREAAKLILELMKKTVDTLPPERILEVWRNEKGRGKYDRMWAELGDGTIENVANGAHTMAVLWQSAWVNGNGAAIPQDDLGPIAKKRLQELYSDKEFVPSMRLSDTEGYRSVL